MFFIIIRQSRNKGLLLRPVGGLFFFFIFFGEWRRGGLETLLVCGSSAFRPWNNCCPLPQCAGIKQRPPALHGLLGENLGGAVPVPQEPVRRVCRAVGQSGSAGTAANIFPPGQLLCLGSPSNRSGCLMTVAALLSTSAGPTRGGRRRGEAQSLPGFAAVVQSEFVVLSWCACVA